MSVRSIARKFPEDPKKNNESLADTPPISRAQRLARVSRRVREESMRVNAEFTAFESDPDESRA
jgi:hypothetical protein